MKIKLFDGYGIDVDKYNYILTKERPAKNKEGDDKGIVEDQISFHATMDALLRSLLERLMKEKVAHGSIKTVEKYIEQYHALKERLNSFVEKGD